MLNPDWLLPDHANPNALLACDDPAESLARHGRVCGLLTMNLIEIQRPTDEDVEAVFGAIILDSARRAFRFAAAAVDLDRIRAMDRQLEGLIRDFGLEDDPGDLMEQGGAV